MNTKQLHAMSKWRAQYNPLRGLTFQNAVSLLEAGERGQYADLQWTYRFIEKREATLRALKQLRLSAIKKLDWDIKTVDCGGDAAKQKIADEQAAKLRSAYERIGNLKQAIEFLSLAEFRGFSHLEKVYEGDTPSNPIVKLDPVPQWHWCRETLYAPWEYNADASSTNHGVPINKEHFIIREVDDPINEIGLLCFLRKNLSQKDWDSFVETYGIPPLFAVLPANIPTGKEEEYQSLAEAVVGDTRGVLPNGADIKTVSDGARGTNPFRDHLTYQDEQLVLAGTSGKLTMLNGPTGLGSGQSETHQEIFDELAQAEAAEISEIFQEQFDRALLDANGYEGQLALAYFQIAAEDKTDVGQILDNAVKANQAGFRMDAEELSEKTGYKLAPMANVPVASLGSQPVRTFNRASAITPSNDALRAASLERLGKAIEKDLSPLRTAIEQAASQGDDAAFEEALTKLKADLPAMLRRSGADSETAKAFTEILGTGIADGAASAREAQTAKTANRGGFISWLKTLFAR